MEFGWAEEDVAFRQELRDFLDRELADNWSTDARALGSPENATFSRTFAGKLAERGWLIPHWPAEFGGSGATPWQHIALAEEMWSIGEPRGPQYMNVNWIGPAIIRHGSPEQHRLHLPLIASGAVIWCQGFSEPEAGSDLAALRTRAVRDEDAYVVNGSKIWTSYASVADYCFLLARTGANGRGSAGITVLLVPMDSPGLIVRPVGAISGAHSFHEMRFDDMRVPVGCRLGPEDRGWQVVREALAYERVGAPRYARAARVLDDAVCAAHRHGCPPSPPVMERIGLAHAACQAARVLSYRVIDERAAGRPPSANSYLARAAMVRAERAVGAVVLELLGAETVVEGSPGHEQLRRTMMAGIAAGTYEMQLNLVARLLLDLPKEPAS